LDFGGLLGLEEGKRGLTKKEFLQRGVDLMRRLYKEIVKRADEQGVELLGLHRKAVLSKFPRASPNQYYHTLGWPPPKCVHPWSVLSRGDACLFHTSDWTSNLGEGVNEAFKRLYGITVKAALAEVTHPTSLDALILSRDVCKLDYATIARFIAEKYRPVLLELTPKLAQVLEFMEEHACVWLRVQDVRIPLGLTNGAARYRLETLAEKGYIKKYTPWMRRYDRLRRRWVTVRAIFFHYEGKPRKEEQTTLGGLSIAALMLLNSKAAEGIIRDAFEETGAQVYPNEKRVGADKFDLWGEWRGIPFVGSLKMYDEPVTRDRASDDVEKANRRLRRLYAFYTHPTAEAARLIQEAGGVLVRIPYVRALDDPKLQHYLKLKGTKAVTPRRFMGILKRKLRSA